MGERWFKYVRHADVPRMEREGWVVIPGLEGTHHGFYSCIMEWRGEGEPPNDN